jgi:beta-lactamase regulating signal transducer with metallopeptidase domain
VLVVILVRGTLNGANLVIYIPPLVLLLLSLVATFVVFFPERYRINILSSAGSQATYEDIVRGKLTAMRIAAVLLLLGVFGVATAMIMYIFHMLKPSLLASPKYHLKPVQGKIKNDK